MPKSAPSPTANTRARAHTNAHTHTETCTYKYRDSHTISHLHTHAPLHTHTHTYGCVTVPRQSHTDLQTAVGDRGRGVGAKTANLYSTGREGLLSNKTEKDVISEDDTFSTIEEYTYENKNISVSTIP